jgi:hypothetical protein
MRETTDGQPSIVTGKLGNYLKNSNSIAALFDNHQHLLGFIAIYYTRMSHSPYQNMKITSTPPP